jgi:hypothetical protein
MQLSSTAFSDGSAIPRRFTCDGEDLSPPLEWSDPPGQTRSFVLLCDDPSRWYVASLGSLRHPGRSDVARAGRRPARRKTGLQTGDQ